MEQIFSYITICSNKTKMIWEWWHSTSNFQKGTYRKLQIQKKEFLTCRESSLWLVIWQPKSAGPWMETTTWTIRITPDQLVLFMEHWAVSKHEPASENREKISVINVFYVLLLFRRPWWGSRLCKYENMAANTSESETKSFHKVYLNEKGVGEERMEKMAVWQAESERGGGGGWSSQQRIQQWRQRPENNMPNPGSHFLFQRRLLWNSSSMANVTTRRETDGARGRSGPPRSPFPSLFHALSPSAVSVRLSRANAPTMPPAA